MGEHDETSGTSRNERAQQAAQRRELFEAKRLLEQFAHPEDLYDEVSPEDADHDLQMSRYRGLARQSGWLRV
ncbi:MAG: hypothetical protein J0I12_10205 [Candidatus Eremiobacteraeota bacterium]|nr:hypothetical protein [Candidatus Eremiobacteraeota bacterium]